MRFFYKNPFRYSDNLDGMNMIPRPPVFGDGGGSGTGFAVGSAPDAELILTGVITALGMAFEFDETEGGFNSSTILVDGTHVINFWRGVDLDGFCQVFELNTIDGSITPMGLPVEFDSVGVAYISSFKIDDTHVMCFWRGGVGTTAWCQIFEIDTADGAITPMGVALEHYTAIISFNSAFKIDDTHVMNFWRGAGNDGFCRIFSVDVDTGTVTGLGAAFEFDLVNNRDNSALKIDDTHVINFWGGSGNDGFCQILEINTGTGAVTPLGSAFEYDTVQSLYNVAILLDENHIINFWQGESGDGYCQVFEIDTADGTITPLGDPFEFDEDVAAFLSGVKVDDTHIVLFSRGSSSLGEARMFEVNASTGEATILGDIFVFNENLTSYCSVALIDATHVVCFWADANDDGFCQIFELS